MKNFAIKLFRRKMSTKNLKFTKQNKKIIGVIGASPKLGVTHLSLSIANFLCSGLKKKTLYIELCDDSQLLAVVGGDVVSVYEYFSGCDLVHSA